MLIMKGAGRIIGLLLFQVLLLGSVAGCGQMPTPTPTSTAGEAQASRALMTFFDLLSEGRYSEATEYYGGHYEQLQAWNPQVDPNDHARLFENGCKSNGLQCLKIRKITTTQQLSVDEHKFTVEFANQDGTLFQQGPCCGASETQQPVKTQFDYTVRKVNDDRYQVEELPVYVP
jgi:hypothetical protein